VEKIIYQHEPDNTHRTLVEIHGDRIYIRDSSVTTDPDPYPICLFKAKIRQDNSVDHWWIVYSTKDDSIIGIIWYVQSVKEVD